MTSARNVNISKSDRLLWQKQFRHFSESHPVRQFELDGHKWKCFISGQGSQNVVLLHSAAAGAESLFSPISLLETEYRVLAPTIPGDITTMRGACQGLKLILDHENIQTAHIIGYSVGGMLAQCFLWQYPERVKSVVLSHTILPTAIHAEGLNQAQIEYGSVSDAAIFDRALQIFRERHAQQTLPLDPVDWAANYVALEELYRTGIVHKADLFSWLVLEEDYHRNYEPHQMKKPERSLPILIIESDADEVYNLSEREALKEAYSDAQVHTFQGWGHLGAFATGPVIQAFLRLLGKHAD